MFFYNKIIISCIFLAILSIVFVSSFSTLILLILLGTIIIFDDRRFLLEKRNNQFRKVALVYFFYLLLNSFNSSSVAPFITNLYVTIEFLIGFILIDIMVCHRYDRSALNYWGGGSIIYLIIAVLFAFINREFRLYTFIFENKNFFGATVLYLYVPLILVTENWKKFNKYVVNFLFLFLLFISGSRSCFLALSLYLILKFVLGTSIIKYFKLYFIGFIILSSLFIYLYIDVTSLNNFEILNNLLVEKTGSQLASGRNVIWLDMIKYLQINKSYLFGLGSGVQFSSISTFDLSLHNLFLQILMQNGIVGLILFLVFLYQFFKMIAKRVDINNPLNRNLFLFIFLLFVQQNFEVFLFQNNMIFTFILAFILPLFNYEKSRTVGKLS